MAVAKMVTLSREEMREFLAVKGKKVAGPHNFSKQIFQWPYCSRCGLLRFRNTLSQKAAKAPCVIEMYDE